MMPIKSWTIPDQAAPTSQGWNSLIEGGRSARPSLAKCSRPPIHPPSVEMGSESWSDPLE
jgi:hypothetical protein